jgi:hypothetical protein
MKGAPAEVAGAFFCAAIFPADQGAWMQNPAERARGSLFADWLSKGLKSCV